MKIVSLSTYKGRHCAELEDGRFVLSDGSMHLALCRKTEKGMLVLEGGIVGGILMRTREDFAWCVENMSR